MNEASCSKRFVPSHLVQQQQQELMLTTAPAYNLLPTHHSATRMITLAKALM
jgi:hypothetical protein